MPNPQSYGIEALILNEHQVLQLVGATGRVRLGVAPEDAYRARQVLEDDHPEPVEGLEEQARGGLRRRSNWF